ncbi:hypothetical protein [Xylanimonas allomyrinae]|uniref:hypothetical protein n=1 Tax=Xylanimonas allomyrinae TaxID=2509459 RepID=UPI003CCC71A4
MAAHALASAGKSVAVVERGDQPGAKNVTGAGSTPTRSPRRSPTTRPRRRSNARSRTRRSRS